jgi:hypothetical protein
VSKVTHVDAPIETYLFVGFALSVLASLGGMVVVVIVLVKLPSGYFGDSATMQPRPDARPVMRWATVLLKNFVGSMLVVLGVIMSVPGIPGPGIVTTVLGLMLLDFAAKRRWARWFISRAPILRATNSLRRKYGKLPFVVPLL